VALVEWVAGTIPAGAASLLDGQRAGEATAGAVTLVQSSVSVRAWVSARSSLCRRCPPARRGRRVVGPVRGGRSGCDRIVHRDVGMQRAASPTLVASLVDVCIGRLSCSSSCIQCLPARGMVEGARASREARSAGHGAVADPPGSAGVRVPQRPGTARGARSSRVTMERVRALASIRAPPSHHRVSSPMRLLCRGLVARATFGTRQDLLDATDRDAGTEEEATDKAQVLLLSRPAAVTGPRPPPVLRRVAGTGRARVVRARPPGRCCRRCQGRLQPPRAVTIPEPPRRACG
jgi:hypothetical protein